MSKTKVVICPYCGDTQSVGERCRACGGFFEPLSRQATHNAMGPWFIRDETRPFQPGASYETILKLIERGQVNKYSIVRGPTTKQFWTVARRVPGLSHVLGYCHNCDASVDPGDHGCHACGVPFGAYLDRNFLGLPDVRALPWEAGNEEIQVEASARTIDFRRAAEPLGISSFASDEELRGVGVPPLEPSHGSATNPGGSASVALAGIHPQPRLSAASYATAPMDEGAARMPLETTDSGVAARALQRRLAQQQQTIRWLIVAMVIAAAVAIVAFAAWLGGRGGNAVNDDTTPTPAQQKAAGLTPAHTPPQASNPATHPSTSPEEKAPQAADQSPGGPTGGGDDAERIHAAYQRATELIALAQDESRPRHDRIVDYEEAISLLKQVKASSFETPEDVDDRIASSEVEIERLKLEEFFP